MRFSRSRRSSICGTRTNTASEAGGRTRFQKRRKNVTPRRLAGAADHGTKPQGPGGTNATGGINIMATKAGPGITKTVPRITDKSAEWLPETFPSLHAGLEYVPDATPRLFAGLAYFVTSRPM